MKQGWIVEKGAGPQVTQVAPPAPVAGMVHLRLRAAALNFADLLMVEGRYQDSPPFPFVPGLEGAGEVIAAPPGSRFRPGDRVAYLGHGALAQQVMAPEDRLTPLPDGLGWAEAAGFQIAYGTSHLALTARAGLRPGEVLAVLGAAGGVGLTAVELGAALGARVIGLARGADKVAAVRAAGAEVALDSAAIPDADLRDTLRAAARGMGARGVDVVYDPVGDAPGLAAFGALSAGGRFLVVGFAGGTPPALPLNHALVKNIAIHGIHWGGYRALDPALLRASLAEALDLAGRGLIRPHAGATLPLERLAEGYAALRERRAIGKLVVTL